MRPTPNQTRRHWAGSRIRIGASKTAGTIFIPPHQTNSPEGAMGRVSPPTPPAILHSEATVRA
jgi:hypothetical protein